MQDWCHTDNLCNFEYFRSTNIGVSRFNDNVKKGLCTTQTVLNCEVLLMLYHPYLMKCEA